MPFAEIIQERIQRLNTLLTCVRFRRSTNHFLMLLPTTIPSCCRLILCSHFALFLPHGSRRPMTMVVISPFPYSFLSFCMPAHPISIPAPPPLPLHPITLPSDPHSLVSLSPSPLTPSPSFLPVLPPHHAATLNSLCSLVTTCIAQYYYLTCQITYKTISSTVKPKTPPDSWRNFKNFRFGTHGRDPDALERR